MINKNGKIKIMFFCLVFFQILYTLIFSLEKNPFLNKKILFAVIYHEGIGNLIDPIAFIDNEKLIALPDELWDDEKDQKQSDLFNSIYYQRGEFYDFFWSGFKIGSITVKGPKQDFTCDSLTAEVNIISNIRINYKNMALATNSKKVIDTKFRQINLSKQENEKVIDIAKDVFFKNRVSNKLLEKIKVNKITSYKRKENQFVIASFQIKSNISDADGYHSMFLIFKKTNENLEIEYCWYQYGEDANMEFRDLIDIFNIDGDDFPELVVYCKYYESWDYKIIKKIRNEWKIIFSGGGGGC